MGEKMTRITAMELKRKKLKMRPAKFYASPRKPPSDSMLPLFDKSHTRNAMARFNQVDFKSKNEKKTAFAKIMRSAKKFKIDIEDFKKRKPKI
ncbi:hypothetical protein JW851_03590 [Candidatus Woesearchaeota archaeon]|nr:hypothetical protein [Candidatus Woesearchaeota archaeon]